MINSLSFRFRYCFWIFKSFSGVPKHLRKKKGRNIDQFFGSVGGAKSQSGFLVFGCSCKESIFFFLVAVPKVQVIVEIIIMVWCCS